MVKAWCQKDNQSEGLQCSRPACTPLLRSVRKKRKEGDKRNERKQKGRKQKRKSRRIQREGTRKEGEGIREEEE